MFGITAAGVAYAVGAAAVTAGVGAAVTNSNANKARDANQRAYDQQRLDQQQALERSQGAMEDYTAMAIEAQLAAAGMSADAIKYAADKSAKVQWDMYTQSREDQMPWMTAGKQALGQLQTKIAKGPGEFTKDPGYQFRLDEGNKNVMSQAAATGNTQSGRTLKALEEYGQNYASNEYDKFINRYYQSLTPLQSLAGLGQNTATNMANNATQTGNSIANIYTNQGNQLANVSQQTGSGLSSLYMNSGNQLANLYMASGTNMGNLTAQNTIAQAQLGINNNTNMYNAFSSGLSNAAMGLGQYYGNMGSSGGGYTGGGFNTNITPTPYQTNYGQYSLSWP